MFTCNIKLFIGYEGKNCLLVDIRWFTGPLRVRFEAECAEIKYGNESLPKGSTFVISIKLESVAAIGTADSFNPAIIVRGIETFQ